MDRLVRKYLVAPTVLALGAGIAGCSDHGVRTVTEPRAYPVVQVSAVESPPPRMLPESILSRLDDDTSALVENPFTREMPPADPSIHRKSSLIEPFDRFPVRLPRPDFPESVNTPPSIPPQLPRAPGRPTNPAANGDPDRAWLSAGSGPPQPAQRPENSAVDGPVAPPLLNKPNALPATNAPLLPKNPPWEPPALTAADPTPDLSVPAPNAAPDSTMQLAAAKPRTAPHTAPPITPPTEPIAEPIAEPQSEPLDQLDGDPHAESPRVSTSRSAPMPSPTAADEGVPAPLAEIPLERLPAVPDELPGVQPLLEPPVVRVVPRHFDPVPTTRQHPVPPLSKSPDAPIRSTTSPVELTPSPLPFSPSSTTRLTLNAAVAERADAIARKGMSLTMRGAFFSARAEFVQSLRLVAQGIDAQTGGMERSKALANGLRALEEAESFLPRGARLEADVDLASLIQSHRTPVLKNQDSDRLTPLIAMQHYYVYAQEQLACACEHESAASLALFGLGKIETVISNESPQASRSSTAKAMAYHQAALRVDHANFPAANELGVLLARCGQWSQAREVLQLSVRVQPLPETWHNLAAVHERLGESELARQARRQQQVCRSQAARRGFGVGGSTDDLVQWMSVQEFVRESGSQGVDPTANGEPIAPSARAASTPPRANTSPWKILPR